MDLETHKKSWDDSESSNKKFYPGHFVNNKP